MAVTKVIELVGQSPASWEDAARSALAGAAKSLHGITGMDVVGWHAVVDNGEITEYRTTVKIAFVVD